MQAGAAALRNGGDAGGDPVLVETVPRALPRAGLRLGPSRVGGLGMLVAEPCRAPLAYGAEDVLGLSLAGLVRACHFFSFFLLSFFLFFARSERTQGLKQTSFFLFPGNGVVHVGSIPRARPGFFLFFRFLFSFVLFLLFFFFSFFLFFLRK